MKLSMEAMASDKLVFLGLKLPESMIRAIDIAAGRKDCGVLNRSAYVRNLLFQALNASARKAAKEAVDES